MQLKLHLNSFTQRLLGPLAGHPTFEGTAWPQQPVPRTLVWAFMYHIICILLVFKTAAVDSAAKFCTNLRCSLASFHYSCNDPSLGHFPAGIAFNNVLISSSLLSNEFAFSQNGVFMGGGGLAFRPPFLLSQCRTQDFSYGTNLLSNTAALSVPNLLASLNLVIPLSLTNYILFIFYLTA